MNHRSLFFLLCVLIIAGTACEKNLGDLHAKNLMYGDSVLYLKSGSTDQIVYPTQQKEGKYSSYPFGLALDENTGAINLSRSETGLRYMVYFDADNGCSDSNMIVVSGINYTDHYYNLAKGDSTALAVYNTTGPLSQRDNQFDVNNAASASGVVLGANGSINLAATVRSGLFGLTPQNGTHKDIPINYRLNDASNKALNTLTVRFYYFTSMKEVPAYLHDLLAEREAAFQPLMMGARSFTRNVKPRPPCVIIIAH